MKLKNVNLKEMYFSCFFFFCLSFCFMCISQGSHVAFKRKQNIHQIKTSRLLRLRNFLDS